MYYPLYDSGAMVSLKERDKELEEIWADLGDLPFDEDEDGRLILAVPWMHFVAGTDREDIWKWFDERYSKGVFHLLYPTVSYGPAKPTMLTYYSSLCFDCETKDCAYNSEMECRYPLVHHRLPQITEEDGCIDGTITD